MQVQLVLAAQLYRGGISASRPCVTVTANGEQRAPSSFAYALTRTPSLNDIPSRSSFVYLYSDRVIADDYWFRNKSSNQMPSAAGCSTKVSGETYAQRLSGSEGAHTQTRGFPTRIYQPLGLTSIPSSRPTVFWLFPGNGYEIKGLELFGFPFRWYGYECEIIGSTRPKEFFHLLSFLRQIPILK